MAAIKKSTSKKTRERAKWLVFVDTNVLLDFYRTGGESAKRTLATLERHKESLITTDQVWMEFLKNRQKVISHTLGQMPSPQNNLVPQFINELKVIKKHSRLQADLTKSHKKVVQTIERILRDPARYDVVYQSLVKIFDRESGFNLRRPDKQRYTTRRLLRKRFSLGYPPRKDDTLRFGDSINWEWIIECAKKSKAKENVVIVSRDNDYGTKSGQQILLNDWLRLEFKERVSRKRKIELTERLSIALKRLDVALPKEDVAEEDRILKDTSNLFERYWDDNRKLWSQLEPPALDLAIRRLVTKVPPSEEDKS